jgi:thioester reductase-like protein
MACLSYDVPAVMAQPPVGSPVANARIYILDSKGRMCPLGMPGEIYVAGSGVGRGYLNRDELTEKVFMADPFVAGERMFRTGDKGRWLDDGVVDFIGRLDFQVKIRGYRVEPGEIEAAIKETGWVTECVVVALEEPTGNKVLVAYCTAEADLDVDSLKSSLEQSLPEYMVPAHIVPLEKMPLNPNGKIDRSKLPRPEIAGTESGPLEPRNPKEKSIAEVWGQILGHRGFGLFDSFYDVGGDSLSAIALLASLSERFDVSASDIFSHTTIADQAANFQEAEVGRSARLLKLKDLAKPATEDDDFRNREERYSRARTEDEGLDTDTVTSFEHVLLTGATGTLGIYLLRELIDTTGATITAVVRAEDKHAAFERLAQHYKGRFDKDLSEAAGDRLTVLTGDLERPGFGMATSTYAGLENTVDTILNSAALTSHYGEWEAFVAANITSVENLADFARKGKAKSMHHVSTTSIGAGQIEGKRRALFTELDVDVGQKSSNLYVRSKLEAEILLDKARAQGLPVNIYRAGNITCDSVTGTFQSNVEDNAFYQQLRAYVNLGAAPDAMDVRNMTFVDQAARAIVLLMGRPGLVGQTFHIQNPQLLSLSNALIGDGLGLRFSRLPFDAFIDFIAKSAGCTGFDRYVDRLLLHLGWQDWLADPTMTSTTIRVDRTVDLLKRCGFAWKKPEPTDLRRFVVRALQDRTRKIRSIPGFENLGDDILHDLAARVQPEYYEADRLLQQEKRPVNGIRFVMDGMVETFRHSTFGWIGTVRVGGPGSCLGEEAVPEDRDATHSVEAIDGVFAFQVTPDNMRDLVMKHPQLGLSLLTVASRKADQAERLFVAV